jgi:ribose transport system permease protein
LRQASLLYILAIGQTLVILTKGIDLSIGGVLSVSSCVAAIFLKQKLPMVFGILIALGIGTMFGLINGIIVAKIKLHPFIVTYAMMWVAKGIGYVVLGGDVIFGFSESFRFFGAGYILKVPVPIIWAGLVFLLFYLLLFQTRFGRALYAVGSNVESARLVGINVSKILLIAYGLSGILASVGGLLYVSRLNSAEPAIGELFLLETIAAVIIGGTTFSGGEGGIERTLIGVLVITIIINGMNILGISSFWQDFVLGTIIIGGTLINQYVRRVTH